MLATRIAEASASGQVNPWAGSSDGGAQSPSADSDDETTSSGWANLDEQLPPIAAIAAATPV